MPYHLRITPTGWKRRRPGIVALGKSADWIEETIAAPRRQGRGGTDWLNPARFPNRDTITPPQLQRGPR